MGSKRARVLSQNRSLRQRFPDPYSTFPGDGNNFFTVSGNYLLRHAMGDPNSGGTDAQARPTYTNIDAVNWHGNSDVERSFAAVAKHDRNQALDEL